jgi:hypothetical protein
MRTVRVDSSPRLSKEKNFGALGALAVKTTPVHRRGRILATRFGLNPNSSSLGVDVTFLLFGASVLSLVTPVVGALLRLRRGNHVEARTAQKQGA